MMDGPLTIETMRTTTQWFTNSLDARREIESLEVDGWSVRQIATVFDSIVVVFEIER